MDIDQQSTIIAGLSAPSPWAWLLIYIVIFMVVLFMMKSINYEVLIKKEYRTPVIGAMVYIGLSLIITFLIGTMIMTFITFSMNLFNS